MSYHWLVPLTAAAANLLIGAGLFRKALRDRPTRVVALLTLLSVAWNLDIFFLYYFADGARAAWWSDLFRNAICFAPPALLHSTLILMGYRARSWRYALVAGYAVGVLLAIANLHGLLVNQVTPHEWGWYPQPKPLYRVFTASIGVFVALSTVLVWWRHRRPNTSRQRVQAGFFLLAGGLQIPFLLTNLLALYGLPVYPLGNLGNAFWIGIIAYAIARHRIMDLDYVVRKVLSFVLAAVPILVPGGIAIAALSEGLDAQAPVAVACAAVAFALLAVLVVPTLQQALETRLHRALFPQRYDSRLRIRRLAETLVHILDRRELLRVLSEALADILEVERCEVFVPEERTHRLTLVYPPDALEALPEEAAAWLDQLAEPTAVHELRGSRLRVQHLFQERGWEVGIPLRIHDHLIAFVALGANRDLRMYSAEDLQLLATVAASASVALENASLSRQLRRSETALERANRLSSVGQLAAGIAHEIRNPLVAVKTFLDLLPERLEDRQFVTQFRELSLNELKRVTTLIQDLLSMGKSTRTDRRVVALAEALEPVTRLMASTARKRQVELTSEFAADLPAVWADPDQLKQIVLNLLLNAIEMSPAEGRVRLVAHGAPSAGGARSVVLEVHDDGPGIPKERQEDIFHPFFTTKETGTGLGLALVHQMVVEHGGEITVESEIGRGSIFRVRLPVAEETTQAAQPLAPTGT